MVWTHPKSAWALLISIPLILTRNLKCIFCIVLKSILNISWTKLTSFCLLKTAFHRLFGRKLFFFPPNTRRKNYKTFSYRMQILGKKKKKFLQLTFLPSNILHLCNLEILQHLFLFNINIDWRRTLRSIPIEAQLALELLRYPLYMYI